MRMVKLPLYFADNCMWLECEFWNNNLNKFSECDMMFDTGASMTSISTEVANRAGIRYKDCERVKVAGLGGITEGYLVNVSKFKLGGLELGSIAMHVLPLSEIDGFTRVEAILGMNIIKHFKVAFDVSEANLSGDGGFINFEPTFDVADIKTLEDFNPKWHRFGVWAAE